MSIRSKIPVTIITGFLGAGKTTFINALLGSRPDLQFALVENEFGEVAIDTQLIKGVEASQMFELKQGCICCTISDEYELVLQELAEKFPNIDHLLIETTGIADPSPVIQPFFRDQNLKNLFSYNGTICLVDAENFMAQEEEEVRFKQLAIADLILLSKAEAIATKKIVELREQLQKYGPFANIRLSKFGTADYELDSIQTKKRSEFDFISARSFHAQIQTKTLRFQTPLNRTEFLCWLEYTLDIYKSQLYRTKGIVSFQGEPFEYIIQGVGGSYELIEGDFLMDRRVSELVFIGQLEKTDLNYSQV